MFPFWLLGYLGVGGVMGLLFLLRERHHVDDGQRWLWMTLLAGLAPVLLPKAPGYSQLFFLDNGQAALTVLGGAWFASRQEPQSPRRLTLALLTSASRAAGFGCNIVGRVKRHRGCGARSPRWSPTRQGFGWIANRRPRRRPSSRGTVSPGLRPRRTGVFRTDDFAARQRSRSREVTSIRRLLGKIDSVRSSDTELCPNSLALGPGIREEPRLLAQTRTASAC
jgi:hypothetical protein